MYTRKRMLEAMPRVLDDTVYDLLEAEIPSLEEMVSDIYDIKTLIYLHDADEKWLSRWEQALNVKAISSDLEERRRYLLTLISSKLKISSNSLEAIAKSFTGIQTRVSVLGSTVTVKFLGEMPSFHLKRFTRYLRELIPAHLGYQIVVEAPMNSNVYLITYFGDDYKKMNFN